MSSVGFLTALESSIGLCFVDVVCRHCGESISLVSSFLYGKKIKFYFGSLLVIPRCVQGQYPLFVNHNINQHKNKISSNVEMLLFLS